MKLTKISKGIKSSILQCLLVFCLLITGCNSPQSLSFDIAKSWVMLEIEQTSEDSPDLIVIASTGDIVPPAQGIKYPQSTLDFLENLDYTKSFVVLFLAGQVNKDDILSEIVRQGNQVTLKLTSYSVGLGNYGFPGLTLPYKLIVIDKAGTWGKKIHFEARLAQGDIIAEADHFVP